MKRVNPPDFNRAHDAAQQLLSALGFEDSGTAARVANAYMELLEGYGVNPENLLRVKFKDDDLVNYDQAVCLRGIEFSSLCEHHLMPFEGVAHVAYVPKEGTGVVGLSKLARLVDAYARRLQVQERMTEQIARDLFKATGEHGVAVILEAQHGCMRCRGIKQRGATMVTSKMLGCFFDKPEARAEILTLLVGRGGR